MFGIGHTELLVIGLVVLVLFGHRLPAVMGSLAEAIRKFQRGLHQEDLPEVAEDRG